MARGRFALRTALCMLVAACGDNRGGTPTSTSCDDWGQWAGNAAHDGTSCVVGQPLGKALADLVYDPFTAQEEVDAGDDLTIHYQAPLIDGDDMYMMTKTGTYTPCDTGSDGLPDCDQDDERYRLDTQVWTEKRYALDDAGTLHEQWAFDSDWKPEPHVGFEPMFQPALAGDLIAIPGANGSLWELDRISGAIVRHVEPLGHDPDTYVAGGIAVATFGTIYYNAIKLDHEMPYKMPVHSWLVAIHRDGRAETVDYASLVDSDGVCRTTFKDPDVPLPWPPADVDGVPVLPDVIPCGTQRPGINSTPAIAADGTIFLVTRAHYSKRSSHIVALHIDLSVKWTASLRGLVNDGCGVLDPYCRDGAALGVDPATNEPPAMMVDDSSSSSPVALPDGGVLYGALTTYNGSRGHLIKLDAAGKLVGTYDFGWDTTPAVVGTGNDYKIILKDNHYGADAQGVDLGPYYITELDAELDVIWQFQSTETRSCKRELDGTLTCVADHPHGFEWCINAPAVDMAGVTYVNSEDGNLYAITQSGQLRDRLFLDQTQGAAYTPLALDHRGRVLTLNNGHLTVVGAP